MSDNPISTHEHEIFREIVADEFDEDIPQRCFCNFCRRKETEETR